MSDQHADGAGMDGVRYEFMERLRALLMDLPQSVREEALQYYRDYLDDVGKEKEKAALKALGSPEQAAEDIRRGLAETDSPRGPDDGGRREDGFPAALSCGGPPPYGNQTSIRQQPGRRRGAGGIVLMVLALLLFLPVLLPIALTAVVIAAAAVFSVLVALFCILVAGAVVFCVGIGLSIAAFMKMAVVPSAAVYMLGGGLICAGVGLAMTVFMVWVCFHVIPPMLRGLVKLCRMPFRKMEKRRLEGVR